jgi:excisionase family DNA binding protein
MKHPAALPNRAARLAAQLVDQGTFDFLMPFSDRRTLLTISEVCGVLERKRDFVEAMIDEGRLEAFAPQGRDVQRKRVTRRSVLLLLAEQSLGDIAFFEERLMRLIATIRDPHMLERLIRHATQQRARL